MKTRREQGLTLIEMLVAIAVMGIVLSAAYASVREGLKLHKDLQSQSTWIVDRCALAEQLTADFRANRAAQLLEADKWSLTRADGTETIYEYGNERVVRFLAGNPDTKKLYSVGKVEVTLPDPVPGRVIRLKFTDAELILTR